MQVLECRNAINIKVQESLIQGNGLTYKVSDHKIDGSKGILSYYMMENDRKYKS